MIDIGEGALHELGQEGDVGTALGHLLVKHVPILKIQRDMHENVEGSALVKEQLVTASYGIYLVDSNSAELKDPGNNGVHSLRVAYLHVEVVDRNQNVEQ